MGEISRRLNAEERAIETAPVSPATLAALIARIQDGTISNNAARQVFESLWSGEGESVGCADRGQGPQADGERHGRARTHPRRGAGRQSEKSVDEYRAGSATRPSRTRTVGRGHEGEQAPGAVRLGSATPVRHRRHSTSNAAFDLRFAASAQIGYSRAARQARIDLGDEVPLALMAPTCAASERRVLVSDITHRIDANWRGNNRFRREHAIRRTRLRRRVPHAQPADEPHLVERSRQARRRLARCYHLATPGVASLR